MCITVGSSVYVYSYYTSEGCTGDVEDTYDIEFVTCSYDGISTFLTSYCYAGASAVPTVRPTQQPTPAPIPTGTCSPYSTTNTNYDTQNYDTCFIYSCPGSQLVASGCNAECVGDQYFILLNYDDVEVAVNDDGAGADCGLCAEITYTTTQACQVYSLREGCYGSESCGGEVDVTGGSTSFTIPPTPAPTTPTPFNCAEYTSINTDNDMVNYQTCLISACAGAPLVMSGCNDACVGDQYLRLYNSNGTQVDFNDDGCGSGALALCAQIEYVATGACQLYYLHEGCADDDSCGGVISVTGGRPAEYNSTFAGTGEDIDTKNSHRRHLRTSMR